MRRGVFATALVSSVLLPACDPEPFTLVVTVKDTSLVAYRDGDGEWKPVEPGTKGRARLRISNGYYSLAWVCDSGVSSEAHVVHSTMVDEPRISCSGDGAGALVMLEGVASPSSTVYVQDRATVAGSFGNYTMFVNAGYHDVLAVSSDKSQVLIQRDVDLHRDRQLDLPVDDRGVPMLVQTPTVVGPQQSVSLTSELFTRNGDHVTLTAVSVGEDDGPATSVPVLPPSVLVESDRHVVGVNGELCVSKVRAGTSAPRIEVPASPKLLLDPAETRWSSEVDWRYVRLELNPDNWPGRYTISATREWMEEAGTDALEIPELYLVPGFPSNLRPVGFGDLDTWEFYVERGDPATSFSSCTTNDHSPGLPEG